MAERNHQILPDGTRIRTRRVEGNPLPAVLSEAAGRVVSYGRDILGYYDVAIDGYPGNIFWFTRDELETIGLEEGRDG